MTLTGIGPLWLYRSIFSLFSITTKGKQADESLTRLYICKYKTLLINRAGKHHRGFYPSSYPRNCSLVIFNKLDTLNFITQSISLRGFFSLQLKYTNYSLLVIQFSLDNKSRGMSSYQLVLDQFVCFYQLTCHLCCKMLDILLHFWLGTHCSFCLIHYCPRVQMSKSIHWLELHFILFYHLSLFVFLLASPNMYTNTKLDLLIGSLSGAWHLKLKKASSILATWPRLAILLTATAIFGWPRALCNSNFWLDVSQTFCKWIWVCEIDLHTNTYTS